MDSDPDTGVRALRYKASSDLELVIDSVVGMVWIHTRAQGFVLGV